MILTDERAVELARETKQTVVNVRWQAEQNDAVYLRGNVWRCLLCSGTLLAECSCCAPPECNCWRVR